MEAARLGVRGGAAAGESIEEKDEREEGGGEDMLLFYFGGMHWVRCCVLCVVEAGAGGNASEREIRCKQW